MSVSNKLFHPVSKYQIPAFVSIFVFIFSVLTSTKRITIYKYKKYTKVQIYPETVAQRCSVKKAVLEIFQVSQENTCATVFFLIKLQDFSVSSCEFCKISKNTFSYRIPPVAASVYRILSTTISKGVENSETSEKEMYFDYYIKLYFTTNNCLN